MKAQLVASETIVKEGIANHQRGAETVGGKLYLTTQRLVFESHDFNIQTVNLIPLMPNSIKVVTKAGQEHSFVVFGRDEWIRTIEGQDARI
ncbi:MAG: GRAM domain-containing protein [Acidobacteria bacterium]|nr:GRAM domain-containing protein [Acidobacteriota bacterium]